MRIFGLLLIAASLRGQTKINPGASITEPIRVDTHVAAAMRDGVKLYADIYRPRREGRFPVLVVRTPYGTMRDGAQTEPVHFAQKGYAVVVQDVRGRYESDGQWDPFRKEAEDGYDTIEWAARQPWSNGKVATEGGSYLGHVQWRAASLAPPSLVAAFPRVASTNIYANWAYFGGAFRLSFNFGWGVVRMPHRIMQPQYIHGGAAFTAEELTYDKILWALPLKESDLASSNDAVKHYRDWIQHQGYDAYWKSISDEERFGEIKVPIHTQGGWYDIFLAGTINGFTGMRNKGGSEKARRESKMLIGAWGHGASQKFGDIDFGPTANRSLPAREVQWFEHYLKGVDNGIDREPPVEIFFMGANKWARAQDWPLPATRYTPYYLAGNGPANTGRGGGTLSAAKPDAAGKDTYEYDPAKPVPTLGGNNCCGTPTLAGPRDQRPIEERNDVLVYSSAVLDSPMAIAGPVKMKLHASTDGRDTDFMVKLIDVAPGGIAINIAEGILRTRFRKGLDRMELLEPGKEYEFEVEMVGTANVFLPGHRIRVDITSSNFPQFDRNPNTGEALGASSKLRVAKQMVFHGGARASHIVLPVVDLP